MPLKEHIAQHIHNHGAVSVAEYMEFCVAHYYATRDPFGAQGDFITAPEISQLFGEMIGAWLYDRWQHASASHAVLCELGPGRGTLMKDILRVTRNTGLHESVDILLVETSPLLRELQARTLKLSHTRIQWGDSVDSLPKLPLFLVANEFFDALPIHQYVEAASKKDNAQEAFEFTADAAIERRIVSENGNLVFKPSGKVIRESSPLSVEIMAKIARHIKKYGGAALIVDYGYASNEHADTLQAVKTHTYADPLADPGEADLTAHVDFLALKKAASATGAYVSDIVEQGAFLRHAGIETRVASLCRHASAQQQERIQSEAERLLSPQQMGRLFKVMAVTSEPEPLPGF